MNTGAHRPRRFLQSHDDDFDVCRAFLVSAMVIAHGYEQFYAPGYNHNFSDFVPVGFVFLAGLTTSVLYAERVRGEPRRYFVKFMRPASKLLALFILCNLGIMLFFPVRTAAIAGMPAAKVAISMLIGSNQLVFGFDILVPIAATIFFSWFLLSSPLNGLWSMAIAALLLAGMVASERLSILDYFGVKFTLIGLMGILTAKRISELSWDRVLARVSAPMAVNLLGAAVFIYFVGVGLFTKRAEGYLKFAVHVLPTSVLLLFMYGLSIQRGIGRLRSVKVVAGILSRYMLFAYLFHIAVINVLFLVIPKEGLDAFSTGVVSLLLLSFTVACCHLVAYLTKKWSFFQKAYNFVFA
jgi:hypothetical protein